MEVDRTRKEGRGRKISRSETIRITRMKRTGETEKVLERERRSYSGNAIRFPDSNWGSLSNIFEIDPKFLIEKS